MNRRVTSGLSRGVLVWLLLSHWSGMAAGLSYSDEKALGRKFELQGRGKLPLIDDIDVVRYVAAVGQPIVAALGDQPFTYRFLVVRDPRLNAFAVPGGAIYVHGGMLTRASNDDEVAGVLGHEVAHVNAHHLARQQEATQYLNYATLLGLLLTAVQPALGAGAAALSTATQLQYRREFEQEADYLGVRYMRQAGFEPTGMLDFFKKMLDAQRTAPAPLAPYLLSHPLTEARLTNLEAVLRTPQSAGGVRRAPSLELARAQLVIRARSEPAQEIVTAYRRAAEAAPGDAQAQYLLGLAYFESGILDAAQAAFEAAQPAAVRGAARDLGRTWLRRRDPEKALACLRRAVEIDPDDALAFAELGKALALTHDDAGALRAYERAVELAPAYEAAHHDLGMLAGQTGRTGEGFYHLGAALMLRGEYEKALRQFENAQPLLAAGSADAEALHGATTELTELLGTPRPK